MAIKLHITNETSTLDTVILGIGENMGEPETYRPNSIFRFDPHPDPSQSDVLNEMNSFEKVLIENGVKIFRPVNIKNKLQLFVRDVGFVIDDEFFISNIIPARQRELTGIEHIIDLFDKQKIIDLSTCENVQIEGGDVMLLENTILVGLSQRTNNAGFLFLKHRFSGRKNVFQVILNHDEEDHFENPLHLDCAFQKVGTNHAIIYEKGIKNLLELYEVINVPKENIFKANKQQFLKMFPNVLSLSKDKVFIEKEFIELKDWLLEKGFKTIDVDFKEISKFSGLLRCTTLPLIRK